MWGAHCARGYKATSTHSQVTRSGVKASRDVEELYFQAQAPYPRDSAAISANKHYDNEYRMAFSSSVVLVETSDYRESPPRDSPESLP